MGIEGEGAYPRKENQIADNPKRLKGRKGSICVYIPQRLAHSYVSAIGLL